MTRVLSVLACGTTQHTSFTHCRAAYGAAMAVWNSATVTGYDVTTSYLRAHTGAAITVADTATVNITQITASYNTACVSQRVRAHAPVRPRFPCHAMSRVLVGAVARLTRLPPPPHHPADVCVRACCPCYGTRAGLGGAILLMDSARLFLDGGIVNNNWGDFGGALENAGASYMYARGVEFARNRAARFGGGFHMVGTSFALFDACTFTANVAAVAGGAIDLYISSSCEVRDSIATLNRADGGHGGFLAVSTVDNGAVLSNTTLTNNLARSGGAIGLFALGFDADTAPTAPGCGTAVGGTPATVQVGVYDCHLGANEGTDGSGGAVLSSGSHTSMRMERCVVEDHTVAGSGGGVLVQRGSVLDMIDVQCHNNEANTGACLKAESCEFMPV